MSKIVRSAADLLYPFALIFGAYIVLHGHLTPGGGFQGGAVLATALALVFVANEWSAIAPLFRKGALSALELGGLLGFAFVGFGGMMAGHSFLYNWLANAGGLFGDTVAFGANPGDLNTGGILPLLNIAVGLEVVGALSVIVFTFLRSRDDEKEKDPHAG